MAAWAHEPMGGMERLGFPIDDRARSGERVGRVGTRYMGLAEDRCPLLQMHLIVVVSIPARRDVADKRRGGAVVFKFSPTT
jgi:hypothetical protein